MTALPIDSYHFRNALGQFATGVTIITTMAADRCPVGVTANSFTSLSLDPPLILWNLRQTSRSFPMFENSSRFAINVLSETQSDIAMNFATRSFDRFQGVDWYEGAHGAPIIGGSLATFECAHVAKYPGGDHAIFVGRVLAFQAGSGRPLLFFEGSFRELPKTESAFP
ncbi:MAG: flavin reductase family protein [Pseudolabrys sp.]|nr:flavin reductase family protein [Pseudolabrys sp.]